MRDRLQSMPSAAQAAAASNNSAGMQPTQYADVLPVKISDGVVIVHPNHGGPF